MTTKSCDFLHLTMTFITISATLLSVCYSKNSVSKNISDKYSEEQYPLVQIYSQDKTDLDLATVSMEGHVTDDRGTFLQGVEVAFRLQEASKKYTTITNFKGSFRLEDIPSQKGNLIFLLDGFPQKIIENITPPHNDLNIVMELFGTVKARIKDAHHNTVDDYIFSIVTKNKSEPINPLQAEYTKISISSQSRYNTSGKFYYENIPPGNYKLSVRMPDSVAIYHKDFKVASGQHINLGDFPIDRGFYASGRVVNEEGLPVAEANVSCSNRAWLRKNLTTTDINGNFTLIANESEDFFFVVDHPDYARLTLIETNVQPETDSLRFILKRGSEIKGNIYDFSGNPIKHGIFAWSAGDFTGYSQSVPINPDGSYMIHNVPNGNIEFFITYLSSEDRSINGRIHEKFKIDKRSIHQLDFHASNYGKIIINILDDNVAVLDLYPVLDGKNRFGPYARYNLQFDYCGLKPGRHSLEFKTRNLKRTLYKEYFNIQSGEEKELDIKFAISSIKGIILDEDGLPAIEAKVKIIYKNPEPEKRLYQVKQPLWEGITDKNGRFEVRDVPNGTFSIIVQYKEKQVALINNLEPNITPITIRLKHGLSPRCRLIDFETEELVLLAYVWIYDQDWTPVQLTSRSALTLSEDGYSEFSTVPEGNYNVRIQGFGYAALFLTDFEIDQYNTELPPIYLMKFKEVNVSVTGNGEPAGYARINVDIINDRADLLGHNTYSEISAWQKYECDEAGKLVTPLLIGPGTYKIWAERNNLKSEPYEIQVFDSNEEEITLELY